jgi:hypothetical protein
MLTVQADACSRFKAARCLRVEVATLVFSLRNRFSIGACASRLLESQDAACPDPRIEIIAMKATTVADLHAGGRRFFFDIAAERLLADRQIGGGALQVEPRARLALSSLQITAAASRASCSISAKRLALFEVRTTAILDFEASPSFILVGGDMAASPKL